MKGNGDNMSEEKRMEIIKRKMEKIVKGKNKFNVRAITINGISGFIPTGKRNWFRYVGRMPMSSCTVIVEKENVEIHNVIVYDINERKKGNGTKMITDIRMAFPSKHIWVDTCIHARPFWEKMVERECIDSIENDYPIPCSNSNCVICHPKRKTGKRRSSNGEYY